MDLYSEEPLCGENFEYGLPAGEHVLVLTLLDQVNKASGSVIPPSLHLNNITYVSWLFRASRASDRARRTGSGRQDQLLRRPRRLQHPHTTRTSVPSSEVL